jgi:hypothetical protein
MVHEALALAPDAAPSIIGCSVTELDDQRFRTRATWRDLSLALDQAQYRSGTGPCLLALRSGRIQHLDDISSEKRFREFVDTALSHGVRSSYSVPVAGAGSAAVNLYAADAHTFDTARPRAVAALLARCVGQLLDGASPGEQASVSANPEVDAARLRSVQVRAAVELLMDREQLTREQAFTRLTVQSRMTQRTVWELAVDALSGLESAEGHA